jgi:predicted component of type VI protein secretion system
LEEIAGLLGDVLSHSHTTTMVPVVHHGDDSEAKVDEHEAALAIASDEETGIMVRSRAEAYRLLQAAADFLQRTEPHSPTPYLIRRAISWGKMSFGELLPELIRNNSELSEILRLLQVERDAKAPKS